MNSDHVQRYHVRQDGFIYSVRDGEWVKVRDIKQFLNNLVRHSVITSNLVTPIPSGNWVKFEDIEQLFRED